MKRVKVRLQAGDVCEQYVYNIADGADPKTTRPRPRFRNEEERRAHRNEISRRKLQRQVNANFGGKDARYSTLTMDVEHEVHTFKEAKRVRANFVKRLRRARPGCRLLIVMGRGKNTSRIHFHMLSTGLDEEQILAAWGQGDVRRVEEMRQHNWYNGVDHGRDYTGLANYLFEHWTEEQGGHRWYASRNLHRPEPEAPAVCRRVYSEDKPPMAPRGMILVESRATRYGYLYFKYVKEPERMKRRR